MVLKMTNIIVKLGIIVWLIYYIFLVKREILRKNKNMEKYKLKYFKQDIFYLFRLDSIFFLLTFLVYKNFHNEAVTNYLYLVFMFTSLVFIFYELDEKYNLKSLKYQKEKVYYLVSFIMGMIPVIIYFFKKDIGLFCLGTLVIDFLVPIGIYLTKVILSRK